MRRFAFAFITVMAVALSSCAAPPRITPPPGYVQVHDPGYDVKVVSAKGHALGVRHHHNPDANANLEFWSGAIEHQKVDVDGMKLASRDPIRTEAGVDGTLFRFDVGEGQSMTGYWVAVFVHERKVTTVEVAGPASALSEEAEVLKKSVQSVR